MDACPADHRPTLPRPPPDAAVLLLAALVALAGLSRVGAAPPSADAVTGADLSAAPQQTTVTLTARKDNTLYEDAEGDVSNGSGDYLFAGRTANGDIRRALIAFDSSDLADACPQGTTVTAVELALSMDRTVAGSTAVSLHRVTSNWGESISDAEDDEGMGTPAAPGDATWLHTFYDSTFWNDSGGDFLKEPSASSIVTGNGRYDWGPTADLLADVQGWLDLPSTNFGWLVMGHEVSTQTAKRFASRSHPTQEMRPTLQLTCGQAQPATATATATLTGTSTAIASPTASGTVTVTLTATATTSPAVTETPSPTGPATATAFASATPLATSTASPTAPSPTATDTMGPTDTPTTTPPPTALDTPVGATATATATDTTAPTPSATTTSGPSPTPSPLPPAGSATPTPFGGGSASPTVTSDTPAPSATLSATAELTPTDGPPPDTATPLAGTPATGTPTALASPAVPADTLYLPLVLQRQPLRMVVALTPGELRLAVGEEASLDLWIHDVNDLFGLLLTLEFDPTVVEVVDADPLADGVQLAPGPFPPPDRTVHRINRVEPDAGRIRYSIVVSPTVGLSGSGHLARVTLRGRTPGQTRLRFTDLRLTAPDGRAIIASARGARVSVFTPTPVPTASATPGPTVTPGPSPVPPLPPPPAGCRAVLANGGFEDASAWTLDGARRPRYDTAVHRGGARALQLGLLPTERQQVAYSSAWQRIWVPDDARSLLVRAWTLQQSEPHPGHDRQLLLVYDLDPARNPQAGRAPIGIVFAEHRSYNRWVWRQGTLDVRAYRGRSLWLYGGVANDGRGGRSWMYLDDVAAYACP